MPAPIDWHQTGTSLEQDYPFHLRCGELALGMRQTIHGGQKRFVDVMTTGPQDGSRQIRPGSFIRIKGYGVWEEGRPQLRDHSEMRLTDGNWFEKGEREENRQTGSVGEERRSGEKKNSRNFKPKQIKKIKKSLTKIIKQ